MNTSKKGIYKRKLTFCKDRKGGQILADRKTSITVHLQTAECRGRDLSGYGKKLTK